MQLLDQEQIARKVTRLAMEILERNTEESELYIIGINNRGLELARRLVDGLRLISEAPLHLWNLTIHPASPLNPGPQIDEDIGQLNGKPILLVDDVANTGRTLYYALGLFQHILPAKIEVAVLVDRHHKSWPIYVTYSGMSLSTTIGDDVRVDFAGEARASLV